MKTYKDLKAFEKRVRKGTDWADHFMLGGRMYNIYEYGGGAMFGMSNEYVVFLNKRTNDMIRVEYRLPRIEYINGVRVELGDYQFIGMEFEKNALLWR